MKLVSNRECGECTACCHHIPIDQEDIVKLPNVDCEHLMKEGGCRIYQKRPNTCANWYCAWRFIPTIGEQWRPDKSGTLMDFTTKAIPEEFRGKRALVLKVIDKEKFLSNPQLATFIINLIGRGLPMFISYGLEPGYSAISAFLNNVLSPAVKNNDIEAVKVEIEWLLNECENSPKNILKIENGHIVSIEPDAAT